MVHTYVNNIKPVLGEIFFEMVLTLPHIGCIIKPWINPIWVNGGDLMYSNIDAERARLGWSRVRLAEELGVSYSTLKNWMRGATEIPASKVIDMARLFRCDVCGAGR